MVSNEEPRIEEINNQRRRRVQLSERTKRRQRTRWTERKRRTRRTRGEEEQEVGMASCCITCFCYSFQYILLSGILLRSYFHFGDGRYMNGTHRAGSHCFRGGLRRLVYSKK